MYDKTLIAALIAALPLMAGAETVRSLDKVRGTIKSKEIAKEYQYQMNGDAKPDGFGYLSFKDEKATEILKLLSPDAKTENTGQISLKKWKNGLLIALVCENTTAINNITREKSTHYDECEEQDSPDGVNPVKKITVALLKQDDQGKLSLAARPYTEQYTYKDEKDSQYRGELQNPKGLHFTLNNHTGNLVVGELDRLDLADYKLNDTDNAFGIRYLARVMYSGGGAINQAITLFTVLDGKLKPVLNAPTYEFADIAGDWNKDGTRQHDVSSTEYILVISPTQHQGFNNIIRRQPGAKKPEQTYRWNSKEQYYR